MCRHPRDKIVIHTTGSIRLVAGDIIDDQKQVLVCLNCGEELDSMPTEYQAPDQRPGWTYLKSKLEPSPALMGAIRAARAAWTMYNEAVNDRLDLVLVDGMPVTQSEINRLGDDAVLCDKTVERMWQALYQEYISEVPF